MKYVVSVAGKSYEVEVKEVGFNRFEVSVNGKKAIIELQIKSEVRPAAKVEARPKKVEAEAKKPVTKVEGKVITAPMNGVVTKILVKPGDEVKEGDTVAVIEAMKMENPIASPHSGVVEEVLVNEGDKVTKDAPLIRLR